MDLCVCCMHVHARSKLANLLPNSHIRVVMMLDGRSRRCRRTFVTSPWWPTFGEVHQDETHHNHLQAKHLAPAEEAARQSSAAVEKTGNSRSANRQSSKALPPCPDVSNCDATELNRRATRTPNHHHCESSLAGAKHCGLQRADANASCTAIRFCCSPSKTFGDNH